LNAYGLTDRGLVRQLNEDSIYCSTEPVGTYPNLFMVADGMGGHLAGDYASGHTVAFVRQFLESWKGDFIDGFRAAVFEVNREILLKGQEDPARSGMGTTLVMLSVLDDCFFAINVGDSRLYSMKDEKLTQITKDHSWVEEMCAAGAIERDSEIYHAKKNIITRAIGAAVEIVPDVYKGSLEDADCFLLCSDGLSNMLTNETIEDILALPEDILKKTGKLINRANEAGGTDNISAILIQCKEVKL